MSTISKERVAGIASGEKCYTHDDVVELARIALASLEAEDVHQVLTGDTWVDLSKGATDSQKRVGAIVRTLYTAPPAPVSVPDECYQHLSELYHAQEKRLFKLAQRIKGPSFDKYAHSPSQAIDVLESAIFGESDDACRAAMLQGAEPVTTAYKLPDGWVACSERMPDSDDFVYIWPRPDFGVELHVAQYGKFDRRDTGWYAQLYEQNFGIEYQPITVTHWMPLPAAPQQEA